MSETDSPGIHTQFRLSRPALGDTAFSLDVDATLPSRGVTAIFGHSGSGKTTFLRCIAGLEKACQGYLSIHGDTWQDAKTFLPTHRRPLGYVFQESSLFPHLTAKGNLSYAVKRSDRAVSAEHYEHVISIMGIGPILRRHPGQLSGGERQRVAIARAMLIGPRLLLMDEPLASLDAARKQEILPYLERLKSDIDIPILYVSHSMDEVARVADHVLALDCGRVAAQGSLSEVFSRLDLPLKFGEETGVILHCTIIERDTRWHLARVSFPGGELWVRDGGEPLHSLIRIRILARDISLTLTSHDDSSILNRLRVEVAEVAPDLDEAMLLVRLRTGSTHLIARITRKSGDHLKLEPGTTIWAQIKSVAIVR